eukprot:gnl/MRDRNA2_/MRDRNA2_40325_c0_seq1.p1 gnl/MRDRNA2_/MRDRNA2_40325_c0~~gnl/MRDRNA2_/MRDRNA2_40325_c0_seq1.p1  ORF type:complete len:207 (-),score=19.27 gnl/MRDRNA2_/MRDRNA2_40325_c0_seq1:16-636(-)
MCSATYFARLIFLLGCNQAAIAARPYSLLSSGSRNPVEMSILPDSLKPGKVGGFRNDKSIHAPMQHDSAVSFSAHVLKNFTFTEGAVSHPSSIGGHSKDQVDQTFVHAEKGMPHPLNDGHTSFSKTIDGRHAGSIATKFGIHGMHHGLRPVQQNFLSHLATRSHGWLRMGAWESFLASVLVMTILLVLAVGTSCIVKVSSGALSFS